MKKTASILLVLCLLLTIVGVPALAADTSMDFKADKTYIVLTPDSFQDHMGSWKTAANSYGGYVANLLAGDTNATASPGNPAIRNIVLPHDGLYKIYALSRDFDTQSGTRYFDVQIGDYASQRLGAHCVNGWAWEATDSIAMFAGEYDCKLIDTSGSYARCAMMIITDDEEFQPADTADGYQQLGAKAYKDGMYIADAKTGIPDADRPDAEIAVKLNGAYLSFDVEPVLMNSRTMVPFRAIFEALGCSVDWDDNAQTAIGIRNGKTIKLPIGSSTASVNKDTVKLDQAAVLLEGRTLVPLRFVSESLGAAVDWNDMTQTVTILAQIPDAVYWFRPSSFASIGSWKFDVNAEGAFESTAFQGVTPDVANATIDDADTSQTQPAATEFNVTEAGEYTLWVRSRDFAENQQGTRYFNVAINGSLVEHKFGTHGGNGYKWAKAPGRVTLQEGINKLELLDTSGFYARCDSILLSQNDGFVPPESISSLSAIASPMSNVIDEATEFPRYAKEQNEPADSVTIENEQTKVTFYKVPTSQGQVVQNEIYAKDAAGSWVKTNNREEELGYLVVKAESAKVRTTQDMYTYETSYMNENGDSRSFFGVNPYIAGKQSWFVPVDYEADGNSVSLVFNDQDGARLKAVWTLEQDNQAPLVTVDLTALEQGYYTVAGWEGGSFHQEDYTDAVAPFRVIKKRVHEDICTLTEQYLFTPMGCYTLGENNEYSQQPVTKGVVAESAWIPLHWAYNDNGVLGINMKTVSGNYKGTIFAPVLGSDQSNLAPEQTYTMQYRVISSVSDWFQNYKFITEELFGITDYRQNTYASLNEAIFNTRELMLDDKYGGWDSISKGHYNMEGKNVVSEANPMQALQDYLLTENKDMLTQRAIPTLAAFLTRSGLHFNRIGESGGCDYWPTLTEPQPIGTPKSGYNLNVMAGLYEMTRGSVPYLYELGLEKGAQSVSNEYGSVAPFSNNLNLYLYTGEQKYLDLAVQQADEYLDKVVYAEMASLPSWDSFIYISYYPNIGSLLDIYEVTKDQKYLDAAEYVGQLMLTALWVPGVDGEKKTQQVEVNSLNTFRPHNLSEYATSIWWAGDKQFRVGRENGLQDLSGNAAMDAKHGYVEGWIPSRVGLGIEQASTFERVSSNIVMQFWVGDFIKLAEYTGEQAFASAARNAVIGRFGNYSGYYQTGFMTMQMYPEYPYEGPDYTSIYWHHIPPFLAMLEEFLIGQTQAWSGNQIKFPALRQQGYAYFNSNQYGHKPGQFFDQDGMWLWLDDGMVDTGHLQIDWLGARKNGMFGLALMNESNEEITTTVSLLDKIPGGASYSGTATVFDKGGATSEVTVTDGKFTITVPGKALKALTIAISEVKEPSFASMAYTLDGNYEIGATMTDHANGKGYVLQLSPEEYYAYVYVTDKPANAKSLQMTYSIGGGEQQVVTASEYPFEFIIKVDDVNKQFDYALELTTAAGQTKNMGKGTLMPLALSNDKGIKYESKFESGSVSTEAIVEYQGTAGDFTPFDLVYTAQGSGNSEFRFVVAKSSIPLKDTSSTEMAGLPVRGQFIDGSTVVELNTVITATEDRGDSVVLCVADVPGVRSSKYNKSDGMSHVFKLKIYPYGK